MQTSLIIVDDFLGNPHEVRAAALKLDYPDLDVDTYFPGRNSSQKLLIEGLDEQISKIVGDQLVPTPGTGHAKCRSALKGDKGRGNVHIDESHWSGILYLTLPEHCQGGTDFFRHIPTNTERAPVNMEELAAMGFSSAKELWSELIVPHSNDESKWERVMRVPMRFNRLILIKPWLWHNAGPSFGDKLENGRLVQLLFFNVVGA